jgi:flagellar basal-body rod protein FlgG
MSGALYMAASGALIQQKRMEVLVNNLSNINTVGFKKDLGNFKLQRIADAEAEKPADSNLTNTSPLTAASLHFETRTDFSPGHLKNTGNPFDLALEGKGFFCVQTPAGIRYTRNGNFTLDQEGILVTRAGLPVLGGGGEISIDGQNFSVATDGNISVDGAQIDRLKIVEFADSRLLKKVGNSLFASLNPDAIGEETETVKVNQGYVELSNVDVVRMMTEMIEVLRGYESYQKVIRTIDDANAKAINEVGNLA